MSSESPWPLRSIATTGYSSASLAWLFQTALDPPLPWTNSSVGPSASRSNRRYAVDRPCWVTSFIKIRWIVADINPRDARLPEFAVGTTLRVSGVNRISSDSRRTPVISRFSAKGIYSMLTNLWLGMNVEQFSERDGQYARRFEYDDETEIVADLGVGVDGTVDVLDDAVIVVTEDGEEFELDIPETGAQAFIKNGVLTIELEAEA